SPPLRSSPPSERTQPMGVGALGLRHGPSSGSPVRAHRFARRAARVSRAREWHEPFLLEEPRPRARAESPRRAARRASPKDPPDIVSISWGARWTQMVVALTELSRFQR